MYFSHAFSSFLTNFRRRRKKRTLCAGISLVIRRQWLQHITINLFYSHWEPYAIFFFFCYDGDVCQRHYTWLGVCVCVCGCYSGNNFLKRDFQIYVSVLWCSSYLVYTSWFTHLKHSYDNLILPWLTREMPWTSRNIPSLQTYIHFSSGHMLWWYTQTHKHTHPLSTILFTIVAVFNEFFRLYIYLFTNPWTMASLSFTFSRIYWTILQFRIYSD